MARASLGLLALMSLMSAGCLITDPPQFKPPTHTKPWLDVETADPDPRRVLIINDERAQGSLEFTAYVTSQDDTEGFFSAINSKVYLDLGFMDMSNPTRPYREAANGRMVPGGSLDQTDRKVTASMYLGSLNISPGCHRMTLAVSHKFAEEPECPICPDDVSSITWQMLRCDDSNGDCGALPLSGDHACPDPDALEANSCPRAQDAKRKMGSNSNDEVCPTSEAAQ